MKSVSKGYILSVFLALVMGSVIGVTALAQGNNPALKDLETGAKEYVKRRERVERGLPKLPTKATPEQISAHKEALLKAVQADRIAFRQGTIFTPEAAALLRRIIAHEMGGPERVKLREAVLEAENKAVPIRVNYPYPESQEFLEMPPTLLMVLPQLPKQLRYRFVGRSMLLVDRENNLIVDYMTNAVP